MIFKAIRNLRRRHILKKHAIPNTLWNNTIHQLAVIDRLSPQELKKLKKVTTLFLHAKEFTGVQGFELNDEKRLIIAIQACVPILNLDIDYYDGWLEIVVYPDNFVVTRSVTNEAGLVSNHSSVLSGEAWSRGPVVLSWSDIERESFHKRHGHNVIIHEFSHKLDMLNGHANGMPPLHGNMHRKEWTNALSQAYDLLVKDVEYNDHHYINAYAATNPGEYFAVVSEYFFTAPEILKEHRRTVYDQLVLYYKQEPA